MKRYSKLEQDLVSEGRDLLMDWALATPSEMDSRCGAVAAFMHRLHRQVPEEKALRLFISGSAFAAVMSLARDGRCAEAGALLHDLGIAAKVGNSAEGVALVADLRKDLAVYYTGSETETDEKAFMCCVRTVFSL